MKKLSGYTDQQVLFSGSIAGYLLTTIVMVTMMRFQLASFKLAGALFIPFVLFSFLICRWFSPKISKAATPGQSVLYSIFAASLVSLLTGATTGLLSTIYVAQKQPAWEMTKNNMIVMAFYIAAGFVYSLPGILIVGTILGKKIYQRNHQKS